MRSISTDHSQNPQQKVIFFIYYCLWLSVRVGAVATLSVGSDRPEFGRPKFSQSGSKWQLDVNDSLAVPILARQSYRLNVLRLHFFLLFFCIFSVVFNCRSFFNESSASFAISSASGVTEANSNWQSKTKIYEKNHLLLRISAVFGWYGPHLMIVMIFVTQTNF